MGTRATLNLQVQKTCTALREEGFQDICTIEVLVRHWDMHKSNVHVPRYDLYDPYVTRPVCKSVICM